MELGRNVKEYRTRLNMSQEQLAQAIFVSRQTISNWETERDYSFCYSYQPYLSTPLTNHFRKSLDARCGLLIDMILLCSF